MKKSSLYRLFATFSFCGLCATASAQLSNTLFFDKYNPRQQWTNPAEQPVGKFYIGFPALSTIGVTAGNSDLVFTDVIKNIYRDGRNQSVLFCDKDANGTTDFLKAFNGNERVFAAYRLNLIDFGFRLREKNYVTFAISNRMETVAKVPGAFADFALSGMQDGRVYDFDANDLSVNSTLFTEFAVGFSRKVNEQLTVGGKLKFLYGHANIKTDFKDIQITGSEDMWCIKGDASVHGAVPGLKIIDDENGKIDSVDFDDDNMSTSDYIKPQGKGFAVDLGATYQLLPQLKLSASVVDLGFIHWTKNLLEVDKTKDFFYDGVDYDINDDSTDYWQPYQDVLENMCSDNKNPDSYWSMLTAKIYAGAEYSFWQDRLGLGLLSKTYILNGYAWEDVVASANFRPWKQLTATLTYNMFDGEWNNIGAGLNFNAGPVNLWCAVDNIPLKYGKTEDDVMFPSNTRYVRANFGLAFMFGYKGDKIKYDDAFGEMPLGVAIKDEDEDGVNDSLDQCPHTPVEAEVDHKTGCPLDSDKDGVADYLDKCPNTPEGVKVDSTGCPFDSDKDGVPDYLDKCADTPAEAFGKVDSTGCPLDTDKDGIPDYLDQCPEVAGVSANHGCPEVKAEVKKLFKKALNGIQFESGKATIKKSSNSILDQIVKVMKENPSYKLSIAGHTDNSGNPQKNMKLSQDRADAVKKYLVSKGVDESRMESAGYGDTKPIASNKKPAGRALNRRVEFEVEF